MELKELLALGLTIFIGMYFMYMLIFLLGKWKQIRIPKNTTLLFTGGLGQGKTFLSVKETIKHNRKMTILYYIGKIYKNKKLPQEKPILYSNIPIHYRLIPIFGKRHSAMKLEFYHIAGLKRMTEYCSVFVSELGEIADQYAFNNPIVMIYLQRFIRLFRHWLDGKFIADDQNHGNIVKPIRTRSNVIYNLVDFHRWFIIFYKVNVQRITVIDDIQTIEETEDYDELPFFMGLLPFKFFTFLNKFPFFFMPSKKYDSRCYSKTYRPIYNIDGTKIEYEQDSLLLEMDFETELKTNYFMTIPAGKELQDEYKKVGHISTERFEYYIKEYEKVMQKDTDYILKQLSR